VQTGLDVTSASNSASAASSYAGGFRNRLMNGNFTINQRGYVSAATLATTVYGHDRWKAGASGGDYSFTQLASDTTITIASGKSLIQVVEDKNIEGGSYTLSWTGTATGRLTKNSATPSGNFAVSPITVTGQTAGTTMCVEFTGANAAGGSSLATNSGTLGKAQLEIGSSATGFERVDYKTALSRCQWYCNVLNYTGNQMVAIGQVYSTTAAIAYLQFPKMRAAPTITMPTAGSSAGNICFLTASGNPVPGATIGIAQQSDCGAYISGGGSSGLVAGNATALQIQTGASATIKLDAEL